MASYRYRMPERLGATLAATLDELDAEDGVLAVTRTWAASVGPDVARNAWPARMKRDGTLIVHARSSVWAFELNQMAEEILQRLTPRPTSLRFVVGAVPEPANKPDQTRQEPRREPDPEAVEVASELAAEVSSAGVREALQRAASLGLSGRRADRRV